MYAQYTALFRLLAPCPRTKLPVSGWTQKLIVLCYQKEAGDLFSPAFFGGEKCLAPGDIIPAGGVLAFFLVL